jgi:DNA-binding IclR family transcriptional regulator
VDARSGHCTAAGKVLLASLDDAELSELVAEQGLPKMTDKTITSLRQLREELGLARTEGYAVDREEFAAGLCSLAVPIRNQSGVVAGAMGVAVPKQRFLEERIPTLLELLRQAGARLSRRLGYPRMERDASSAAPAPRPAQHTSEEVRP